MIEKIREKLSKKDEIKEEENDTSDEEDKKKKERRWLFAILFSDLSLFYPVYKLNM